MQSHQSSRYPFLPYQMPPMSEQERLAATQQFLSVMERRHSVRDFSSQPVPYELIENAIRAASLAPSGANQQPWTFVVISNPEIKRQLRVAAEAEEKESYERRMSSEWLEAYAAPEAMRPDIAKKSLDEVLIHFS